MKIIMLGRLFTILFFLVVFAGAGFLVVSLADTGNSLRPDDRPLVLLGHQVYAKHCASCHGKNLEGEPNWRQRGPNGILPAPPHDASGHTWHHSDEQLIRLTKLGPTKISGGSYPSAMPGYEDILSEEEIVAVLSFIKSRWPASIRARHDEINRRASEEN